MVGLPDGVKLVTVQPFVVLGGFLPPLLNPPAVKGLSTVSSHVFPIFSLRVLQPLSFLLQELLETSLLFPGQRNTMDTQIAQRRFNDLVRRQYSGIYESHHIVSVFGVEDSLLILNSETCLT